jgi:AcrR family transcriptional regulator
MVQNMETGQPTEVRPGLRERKKQKTRETIVNVALELFCKQGYEQTTIAEIADAADVSPRTIFAYFPSKEDILFCDVPEIYARWTRVLERRGEDVTALDALRDIIAGSLDLGPVELLRKRIVAGDETLKRSQRARMAPFEQMMVDAIATDLGAGPGDLGAGPGDIRPQIVAAALIAALSAIRDRDLTESFSSEQAEAALDDVIEFVRGGLEALKRH